MHRPIRSPWLGELTGTIQWIHDPHSRPAEAGGIICTLLGQDRIVGVQSAERLQDQLVRALIASGLQHLGRTALRAYFQQASTGQTGDVSCSVAVLEPLGNAAPTRTGSAWAILRCQSHSTYSINCRIINQYQTVNG